MEMNTIIEDLYDEPTQTVESVIDRCTRVIERDAMVAGAGRKIRNPMLSVFLGEDAIAHIREIQAAYFSCWSDYAKKLKVLKGAYTVPEIENAIVHATRTQDNFYDETVIRIAWFWDIMDDRFEELFNCVKQDFATPVGLECRRTIFIFCSQSTTGKQNKTRERLEKKLIPWAQEKGIYLVVLSDATGKGFLKPSGIAENYRLAANLLLILNSTYPLESADLGRDMDFAFGGQTVWSASYRACSKNFYDIVGISLRRIIDKYKALAKEKPLMQVSSVEEYLCGSDKTYFDFLDEIFQEVVLKKCPDDFSLWYDVPYTEAIAKYENKFYGADSGRRRGLLSLFSRNNRDIQPEDAIYSLAEFWDCCVDYYYRNPVQQWLDSPEGIREVTDYMYSRMTAVLNNTTMKGLLSSESQKVLSLNESLDSKISRVKAENCQSVPMVFHEYACREVKLRIYGTLLKWLAEAMRNLNKNAAGFEELLSRIQDTLKEDDMEGSVVRAYGNYMASLIDNHIEVLNQCIRPCEKEGELLQQLEQAFISLVQRDPRNVYQMTLQDNLEFLIRNGGAAGAIDVISACFKYDMAGAGRLLTYMVPTGTVYCMMNDAMNDLIAEVNREAVGQQFIVNRSDRIERLFLYSVDPKYIRYSN